MVYSNEGSKHERCCCGCMHVKTGVKLIAGYEIFGIAIGLMIRASSPLTLGPVWSCIFYLTTAFCAVAVLFMIYALIEDRRGFLTPQLAYLVVQAVVCLAAAWFMFEEYFRALEAELLPEKRHFPATVDAINLKAWIYGLSCLVQMITFVLCVWFFSVVFKLYKFYEEQGESLPFARLKGEHI